VVVPRSYPLQRALDWAVLVTTAPLTAPVALVCAGAVRLTSAGPVLFRQTRIGIDGEPFEALKFRTMVSGDNPLVPDASRITSAGRWLRRLSLDELPQLVNVARGEMSVVGPRPMLPAMAAACDDRQRGRFATRPGLTGWAQVKGRNALRWAERIELDLHYVAHRSLGLDLRCIILTAAVVLTGAGAAGHDPDDPFVLAASGASAPS
jgi:lipopolysaccharide/colanic/teichoic acid biosynthesis glycosyltransferase